MPTVAQFEVNGLEVTTCSFCGKEDRECFLVRCTRGTINGPVCISDFKRLVKSRTPARAEDRSPPNGSRTEAST